MPQRKQTAPSAVSARFSPASSLTTSSRASMDSKLEDEPRRARNSRFTRTLRPRRSTPLPQRADRSASRHRAGNSTRRWKRRSPHRTDEGSESPPSASRRGGMPPGRVLDSRSAAAQGMRSRWHCWGPTGRPVGADTAHKKRPRRRGGRRGETRGAAHRTAREKAAQDGTREGRKIKEATDFEEAPPTERAKEPTRTTRTEELSEVAKRSQQHRQQAASARTASADPRASAGCGTTA